MKESVRYWIKALIFNKMRSKGRCMMESNNNFAFEVCSLFGEEVALIPICIIFRHNSMEYFVSR